MYNLLTLFGHVINVDIIDPRWRDSSLLNDWSDLNVISGFQRQIFHHSTRLFMRYHLAITYDNNYVTI